MTLFDLINTLEVAIGRGDLEGMYRTWVNRALRSIQHDNDFNCMRSSVTPTILNGETSVPLPSDFKQFTTSDSPVCLSTNGAHLPCLLTFQESTQRLNSASAGITITREGFSSRGPDVFLTNDGNRFFLNIDFPATQNLDFRVSHFRFLPELLEDRDSNHLTTTYEEMVLAKVKSVAFEEISDPLAEQWERTYELKKRKAVLSDQRAWLCGRRLQLGG